MTLEVVFANRLTAPNDQAKSDCVIAARGFTPADG